MRCIGEVKFKDEILPGEQFAIIERNVFEAVQAKLTVQTNNYTKTRMQSEALLSRRLFDDRGNRMGPTYARKKGIKYRYYLSSVLSEGRSEEAGSISRVSADEIENLITRSVREHRKLPQTVEDKAVLDTHIGRIEIHSQFIAIQLLNGDASDDAGQNAIEEIRVPWQKKPSK